MHAKLRAYLTYANTMATIAVFVALGGSSYAALRVTSRNVPKDALTGADIKNLTGKDLKDNSVTGKDVKNLGSADVANGRLLAEDFAPGQLPKGETGAPGPPGPLPNALPSGKTLRGAYAVSGEAGAAGEAAKEAQSFAFPMPSDYDAHVIFVGAPATSECPGSSVSPTAAPGHLCVYEGQMSNATLATDSPSSTGSERFGVIFQITSGGAGAYQSRGTWATTAP